MKQVEIYIFFVFFILAGCQNDTRATHPLRFIDTDTTKPFKKEISSHVFYETAKSKQKQLGLYSLENGFNNLEIRIWYDFSLVRDRNLVVITNKDTNWTATIYHLQVDWGGKTETIVSKKTKNVFPKSGWKSFSKRLLDLQILTLPTQDSIEGYNAGEDGKTYNIEVATKKRYRFYGYWEPEEYENKFWQAKKMTNILKLLENELGVE